LKVGVAPAGGLRELACQAGQVHRLPIQRQGTKKILDFIQELATAFRPLAQSSQNFPFGSPLQRQTGFQDSHARIDFLEKIAQLVSKRSAQQFSQSRNGTDFAIGNSSGQDFSPQTEI